MDQDRERRQRTTVRALYGVPAGMIDGQVEDLALEDRPLATGDVCVAVEERKTGALLEILDGLPIVPAATVALADVARFAGRRDH